MLQHMNNPLLTYRSIEESEVIEQARKKDAQDYFRKYRNHLIQRVCPVCGSAEHKSLTNYAESFSVVQCEKCTLIFIKDAPNKACLDDYYQNSESVRLLTEFYINRNKQNRNPVSASRLANLVDTAVAMKQPHLNILEVGCGDGKFLRALKEALATRGIHVTLYGIEPNLEASGCARANGISIEQSYLGLEDIDEESSSESYDLILLFEVIEHVVFPEKMLKKLYSDLKLGGVLILTTPNISGLENILTGYNGYRVLAHAICPPAHIQGFNRLTLGLLANRVGFFIHSIEARGLFDAYALQHYIRKNSLAGPGEQLYGLNKYFSLAEEQVFSAELQCLVNLLDASSTMTATFRK